VGARGRGGAALEDEACALEGIDAVGFGEDSPDDAGSTEGACACAWEANASARAITENLGTQPFMAKAN
jgi:hypothetical protein